MRMKHPQRVHSDCLLVPSESTLSRKEGHTRRPEGPRTHHEQSTVSPWVMVQSACLAGAWCGNVIPGVNTGLLTSEGCSPPWTPHSRKETHFDAPPPRSDGKTCKACRGAHSRCMYWNSVLTQSYLQGTNRSQRKFTLRHSKCWKTAERL